MVAGGFDAVTDSAAAAELKADVGAYPEGLTLEESLRRGSRQLLAVFMLQKPTAALHRTVSRPEQGAGGDRRPAVSIAHNRFV